MEVAQQWPGVLVAGGQRLVAELTRLEVVGAPGHSGLVFDASDVVPTELDALEAELSEVFRLTQQAALARIPVVYVLDEPSIWGHTGPLRAALATAMLGGMRSLAVEGQRDGLAVNAVALSGPDEIDRAAQAVSWLMGGTLSGQLITCGSAHLGRPAA